MTDLFLGYPDEGIKNWIKENYYLQIPFCIEALEDGDVKLTKTGTSDEISLLCSFDNKNWSDWNYETGTDLKSGEKLYLKSKTDNGYFSLDYFDYNSFKFSKKVKVYGNIMSLIYNNYYDKKDFKYSYCFYYLFSDCTTLVDASNLKLPVTTLSYMKSEYELITYSYCYSYMFADCTSLTSAPELPATTLAYYCYSYMFSGCTSLTSAPKLPATTLYDNCYECMFSQCTNLTSAPELPATTLQVFCYNEMFIGCTSLTSAPELPATTLAYACYQDMFSSCTSLITTPKLPATTLAENCYAFMFSQCTSLTSATELPATTLVDSCYYDMFFLSPNISELHYPKLLENDSTFTSMTGSPTFGADNATIYYDL